MLYNGKFYWLIWLLIISCLLTTRALSLGEYDEHYFNIAIIYIFSCFFSSALVTMVINWKLMGYLHKNKKDIWESVIDYSSMLGKGTYNVSGYHKFMFTEIGNDDPHIKKLKSAVKHIMLLTLTIFLSSPLVFLAIMFPYHTL